MAKVKHNPEAGRLITEYIESLPLFSKEICNTLREIILKADDGIIEDWKWGPNYFHHGMVCGYGAFKEHVTFFFHQGALLNDPKGILKMNPGNLHNRHIKYRNVGEIKPRIISAYLKEAIDNNKQGNRVTTRKDKTVVMPDNLKAVLKKAKLLNTFEELSYVHRKDFVEWITSAKREETIEKRTLKMIELLSDNMTLNQKYKTVS